MTEAVKVSEELNLWQIADGTASRVEPGNQVKARRSAKPREGDERDPRSKCSLDSAELGVGYPDGITDNPQAQPSIDSGTAKLTSDLDERRPAKPCATVDGSFT